MYPARSSPKPVTSRATEPSSSDHIAPGPVNARPPGGVTGVTVDGSTVGGPSVGVDVCVTVPDGLSDGVGDGVSVGVTVGVGVSVSVGVGDEG